jgi:flavin reductase (DIM6/NTAB) family NADH-FMN oxidoreductase RutF
MMKELPLAKVYQLLEPGPVVLVSTAHRGKANVMAMSWHMMVEFEPPMVACILSEANFSFAALRATRECVIAIPPAEMAKTVAAVGNCSGREVRKFERFGLTPVKAGLVAAPLVAECFANIECKVVDTRLVNAYNLFVLEVVKAWIDPKRKNAPMLHHRGYGKFVIDGETVHVRSAKP